MKQQKATRRALLATALSLAIAPAAFADIVSDQAAALLVYPRVIFANERSIGGDTIIQLSNASTQPQNVHCFYIDASSRCSVSERICDSIEDPCETDEGICLPRWVETDFDIMITPRQPLAWAVSVGLTGDLLPLTGPISGPGGSTNVGTSIPPVPFPFIGELKCIAVDGFGDPVPNNVLFGEATVVRTEENMAALQPEPDFTVDKSNAIGIEAIDGDSNQDKVLVLGGDANEYNGCPQVLIVNHPFDFAVLPGAGPVVSRLTLVPCTQNLLLQIPGSTTAQYLVFNEFEQRFSTSAPVECFFDRQLSLIDTRDQDRSIFSAFVAGTIVGQTRIRGVQQGLLGVLTTIGVETGHQASSNLHFQGERPDPDTWTLP